jgi:hypothetical protein
MFDRAGSCPPTNGAVGDERYVVTARGRDDTVVAPIKGVIYSAGQSQELTVAVDVVPLAPSGAWDRPPRRPTRRARAALSGMGTAELHRRQRGGSSA